MSCSSVRSRARGRRPTSRLRPSTRRTRRMSARRREAPRGCRARARESVERIEAPCSRRWPRGNLHRRTRPTESCRRSARARRARRRAPLAGHPRRSIRASPAAVPTDFDTPPSVNASTSARCGDVGDRRVDIERIVREHFVGDERPSALAADRDETIELPRRRHTSRSDCSATRRRSHASARARRPAWRSRSPIGRGTRGRTEPRRRLRDASGARRADSLGAARAPRRPGRTAA